VGVNGVPEQLSDMINKFSSTRTGTVVVVDPMMATVDVGTTVIRAAYARQSEPEPGDVVAILRQGASWFVLGTSSVSGGNAVQNPSFEEIDTSGKPVGWTLYNITNTSNYASVYAPAEAPDGEYVLEVMPSGALSASSFVYSPPIAVVPGQIWELGAHVNGYYPSSTNVNTSDPSLQALWFANATDLYPTTSDTNDTAASVSNITQEDVMSVMRGQVTVPTGGVFMRVALGLGALTGAGAHFDFVTARQVS
jgi:hypothetical protein